MEFRRAKDIDYVGMVALQEANLVGNLSNAERSDGFLSAMFNASELAALNENLCVIVASDHDQVKGLLVASTTEFNSNVSLPSAMIARYPHAVFNGQPLSEWKSFIAGPVVIDKSARGTGAFAGMYQELLKQLPSEYDVAVTLVSLANGRSLRAHEKIGYQRIDSFGWNNREFAILAMTVH